MAKWASIEKKKKEAAAKAEAEAAAKAKQERLEVRNKDLERQGYRCIKTPIIGCGGPAGPFRDEISYREYHITHLCQKCQDEVFVSAMKTEG